MTIKEAFQPTQTNEVLMGFNAYMEEIGKRPIMKKEEHVRLGREIQALKRSLPFNNGHIDLNLLTPEEKNRHNEYRRFIRELVDGNLGLVPHFVKHYYVNSSHALDFEDLIQAGNFGLMRAAEYFDPGRGFAFSTYARFCIRSSVITYYLEVARAIKIPVEVQVQLGRMLKRESIEPQDSTTTEEEPDEVRDARRFLSLATLDQEMSKDRRVTLKDVIPDQRDFGEEVINHVAGIEIASKLLNFLPPREREVIDLYFGLNGNQPMSREEIAKRFNVTGERIRQLRERALERLRSNWQVRKVKEDYYK